jgi:hypothetical protein
MQFRKIEQNKVYETWEFRSKNGLVAYIFRMPEDFKNNEYYHFKISGAKSKKYMGFQYQSIDELRLYPSFEDTVKAIKEFWHKNFKG